MNSRKWMAITASTLMAASTMFGCSSGSGSAKKDSGDSSSAASGKPLIVGTTQELAGSFSPLYASTAYDQWVTNLVYQSMMKYNSASKLELVLLTEEPTCPLPSN